MDSTSLITLMVGFGVVAVLGLVIGWAMWESNKAGAATSRHEPATRSRIYAGAEAPVTGVVRTTSGTIRTAAGGAGPQPAPTAHYYAPQAPVAPPSASAPTPTMPAPTMAPPTMPAPTVTPPPTPAPAPAAPAYTTPPRSPQTTVFRLGRILWVDDNPDSHVPDVVALHRMGLTVTVATHWEAALAYLSAEKYLLVVTDCHRTGDTMSTAQFVHTVRRTYPGVPTIAYDPGAVVAGPGAPELPHDEVITTPGALPGAVARLLGR